jgi:hypothetical protein
MFCKTMSFCHFVTFVRIHIFCVESTKIRINNIKICLLYIMVDISGELIIALSSIFCTGIGSILIYVYRIKCNEMSMCCCWNCKRDVHAENQSYALEHPLGEVIDTIPPSSRRSSMNTT